jgi:hypothetical protein
MTDHTALDGLPDVDIRLKVLPAHDPRVPAMVVGVAECRFCPECLSSPDPRTLVRWADKHEASEGHKETKHMLQAGAPVAPPEPAVTAEDLTERPSVNFLVSQGPAGDKFGGYDGHSVDQILGSDRPL